MRPNQFLSFQSEMHLRLCSIGLANERKQSASLHWGNGCIDATVFGYRGFFDFFEQTLNDFVRRHAFRLCLEIGAQSMAKNGMAIFFTSSIPTLNRPSIAAMALPAWIKN